MQTLLSEVEERHAALLNLLRTAAHRGAPAKPGDARGAYAQGAQNVVGKLKDVLTPDS